MAPTQTPQPTRTWVSMDVTKNTKDAAIENAFGLTEETPCVLNERGNRATELKSNGEKAHTEPMGFLDLGLGPSVSANQNDSLSTILIPNNKSNGPACSCPNPTIQDHWPLKPSASPNPIKISSRKWKRRSGSGGLLFFSLAHFSPVVGQKIRVIGKAKHVRGDIRRKIESVYKLLEVTNGTEKVLAEAVQQPCRAQWDFWAGVLKGFGTPDNSKHFMTYSRRKCLIWSSCKRRRYTAIFLFQQV